jgi:RimJ/RimL family protein N-acetyltransferase
MRLRFSDTTFGRLSEVDPALLIAQMNNPLVRSHMPLAGPEFDEARCARWVAAKEQQWTENGLGPWAFFIDGAYAGWGGFQLEDFGWDLGLVLNPGVFGAGPSIARKLVDFARNDPRIDVVYCLLPPSRKHFGALRRFGAVPDGTFDHDGQRFLKFRLDTPMRAPGVSN